MVNQQLNFTKVHLHIPAIYADAGCLPIVRFNCLYDCHTSTDGVSAGVIYIQTNANSDANTLIFAYLSSRSCSATWNTLLFRSKTSEQMLAIQFQYSNTSMCSSNNDGIVFIQDFWIDVLYCNFAFNKGYDGILFTYNEIFNDGRAAGDIHHCNFNNNYVRGDATVYQDSSVTTGIEYLYFIDNDETYTIGWRRGTFKITYGSIFCDDFKPQGFFIGSGYVNSTEYTLEPHTFYQTANCKADITTTPTPSLSPTPYSPTPKLPQINPTFLIDIRQFIHKLPHLRIF